VSVLADIRQEAAERFTQLGWPTTRLEAWKYTSLAALAKAAWHSAADQAGSTEPERMGGTLELHFVNGRLVRTYGEDAAVRLHDQALLAVVHPQRQRRAATVDGL